MLCHATGTAIAMSPDKRLRLLVIASGRNNDLLRSYAVLHYSHHSHRRQNDYDHCLYQIVIRHQTHIDIESCRSNSSDGCVFRSRCRYSRLLRHGHHLVVKVLGFDPELPMVNATYPIAPPTIAPPITPTAPPTMPIRAP